MHIAKRKGKGILACFLSVLLVLGGGVLLSDAWR